MVGNTLSHYNIIEELGRGGMGVVYKATDIKLDRTVAIKVLPSAALASDEDKARFYREAKAAAKLNHPHIASVFEIDEAVPSDAPHGTATSPFIVMEFIEGESVETHIKKGPLKLDEAVRIASEIAEGLKAAHAKGIVHRDIKAANVMLDGENRVKILDFGLALTTQSTKLTRMGSTLGTVAYMSPEQARGEAVDARTDIWALGVTLYEMITGRHPFGGDYEQAVVYSILNEEPEPLTAVRAGVPMGLEWIVSKMTAKNAKDRYQDTADLLVDLKTVDLSTIGMSRVSTTSVGPTTAKRRIQTTRLFKQHALPVLITAAVVTFALRFSDQPKMGPASSPLLQVVLDGVLQLEDIDISPDGTRIAFQGADRLGRSGIFEREWAPGGQLYHFEGSESGSQPAYSPDGKRITYRSYPLRIHPVGGGSAQEVPGTATLSRASIPNWLDNDHVLMTDSEGAVVKVNVSNGNRSILAQPDSARGQGRLIVMHLDKSRKWLLVDLSPIDSETLTSIGIVELEEGKVFDFQVAGASYPSFVSDGIITYTLHGSNEADQPGLQMIQRLSKDRTRLEGSPVQVPSGEAKPGYAYFVREGDFMVWTNNSSNFSKQYLYRQALEPGASRILMKDVENGGWPTISPDGFHLARVLQSFRSSAWGDRIEILDLQDGSSFIPYRDDSILSSRTIWSHDGNSLYFAKAQDGQLSLFTTPTDFSSEPRKLLPNAIPLSTSADGRFLAYNLGLLQDGELTEVRGLHVYDLETGHGFSMKDSVRVIDASFSPNADFVAVSVRERNDWRIQVKPLNQGVWQEIDDGQDPIWSPDGGYLYYHRPAPLRTVFRKPVSLTPTPNFSAPKQEMFGHWYSRGAVFDFNRDLSFNLSSVHIDPGQNATISRFENFHTFAQKLLHDRE